MEVISDLRKQQRNGKQVYQLGAATLQLDKNLVYVAPRGGEGEWKAGLCGAGNQVVLIMAQVIT